MDAKLVNPFIDAFTAVMPQIGFPEPKRAKVTVKQKNAVSLGVSVIVGFTKQIRGNVVYNMTEDTAKFIASTMMMGMPVENFDEMAQSAISELSNMLTANTATHIAGLGLEVDISTPSLSIGEDFQIKISSDGYLAVDMDLGGHIVELDISEGTAIEQHRFFRQRQNWMSAVNRIFITSCLQDKSAVCILIFSFAVHIRDVFCR